MKTDIDYELIKDADFETLVSYIKDKFYIKRPTNVCGLKKFSKILRALCTMNKIYPSNEQYIFILCNYLRVSCGACAGAGKTTMAIFKACAANQFLGINEEEILLLAYNVDAVASFRQRLDGIKKGVDQELRVMRNSAILRGQEPPKVDYSVPVKMSIKTFHSFCKIWVKEYMDKWGMIHFRILEDSEIYQSFESIVNMYVTTLDEDRQCEIYIGSNTIDAFIQLYNYVEEKLAMNDPEQWVGMKALSDLSMFTIDEILNIFTFYKNKKKLQKVCDFVDILTKMSEIMTDPEAVKRMRKLYKYIIVDEYQDFTPVMKQILKRFFNGYAPSGIPVFEDGYLVVIGDDDQSIYQFKGTDMSNFLEFKEDFTEGKISADDIRLTSMSINRRCSKAVLDVAREIATSIPNRIEKPIWGIKAGGNICVHDYSNSLSEIDDIILNLDMDSLNKSVIAYRNIVSCNMLTIKLLDRGIPFRIGSGVNPFTDFISKTLDSVLRMLFSPNDAKICAESFSKCMPHGKHINGEHYKQKFLDYQKKRDMCDRTNYIPPIDFWDMDWSEERKVLKDFDENLTRLIAISRCVRGSESMEVYMRHLIGMISKHYLRNVLTGVLKGRYSDEFIKFITNYYVSDLSYSAFMNKKNKMIAQIKERENGGVYLTTFHGLKGLEYENVYAMDMDDYVFPGTDIRGDNLTEEMLEESELNARRLLYVLVTRAITNFHIWFSTNRPSRYSKYFIKDKLVDEYSAIKNVSDNSSYDILNSASEEFILCSNLVISKSIQAFDENAADIDLDDIELDIEEISLGTEHTAVSKEKSNRIKTEIEDELLLSSSLSSSAQCEVIDKKDSIKSAPIINSIKTEEILKPEEVESTGIFFDDNLTEDISDDMEFDDEFNKIYIDKKPNLSNLLNEVVKEV